MPHAALIAAWLAGLLGGLHCIAMCGAYVTIAHSRPVRPLEPRRSLYAGLAAAHAGRIATYAALAG